MAFIINYHANAKMRILIQKVWLKIKGWNFKFANANSAIFVQNDGSK